MASITYIYSVKNTSGTNLTQACVLYDSNKETVLESEGQTQWKITNTHPSTLSPCYIYYDGKYYKIESSDWIEAGGSTYYVNIDNQTPESSGDSSTSTFGKIYLGDILISSPPEGSIEITENGNVDVAQYATAVVNVSGGGGGGSATITNAFNGSFLGTSTSHGIVTHQYAVSDGTIEDCWIYSTAYSYSGTRGFTSEESETAALFKTLDGDRTSVSITSSGLLSYNFNRSQSKVNEYPWQIGLCIGVAIKLSNGTVLFDYFKTYNSYQCLVKDTLIALSNGSTKLVQDITYEDKLLVWDFDKGEQASAFPLWIAKSSFADEYKLVKLSNGTELKLVGANGKCHRLFNVENGSFVYAVDMVGEHTVDENGNIVEVLSVENVQKEVEYYNIITRYHINLYANGILTSCRYSNLYPIHNMKYVKDGRLIVPFDTYSDYKIDKKYYDGLRLGEQIIPIGETVKYVQNLEASYNKMFAR